MQLVERAEGPNGMPYVGDKTHLYLVDIEDKSLSSDSLAEKPNQQCRIDKDFDDP